MKSFRLNGLSLAAWAVWSVAVHCGFCVARSCDLCAVYNAEGAKGESSAGFSFTLAEQFVDYRTTLYEGDEFFPDKPSRLRSSVTHLVPAYSFTPWFGLSLNTPIVYRDYSRTDLRYAPSGIPSFGTERGTEFGLGDLSLIGRVRLIHLSEMKYGVTLNLLAGVKFPTGDTSRLDDELEQTRIFESFLPPGYPHDPLGHSVSGLHPHEITAGSGSFDGIFGLAFNSRYDRFFFNGQLQFYYRTEGDASFQYGNEILVSGGPGAFLWLSKQNTLSLQATATFEAHSRDSILGRKSGQTGGESWFVGPQLAFTHGRGLTAQMGVDVPVRIANNGLQIVPTYRLYAGLTLRF